MASPVLVEELVGTYGQEAPMKVLELPVSIKRVFVDGKFWLIQDSECILKSFHTG
jgi:hypothetical protein